jgi:hypothetical protein
MAKRKLTKGQTTIYKTLHRQLTIEPHYKSGMISGAPEKDDVYRSGLSGVRDTIIILLTMHKTKTGKPRKPM